MLQRNPLLDFSGLPRFTEFDPDWVTPAVESLLANNRALIEHLVNASGEPDWDYFAQPLEDANEKLRRTWGQVAHLNAVMNTPQLRDVYNANLQRVTQYYAELMQHQGLQRRFQALHAAPQSAQYSDERRKVIDNLLRDFRLGGAQLSGSARARFTAIVEELAQLSATFSDNLLDATNAYSLYVEDSQRLAGLPADVIDSARSAADQAGRPGWRFTLHAPCYLPVMQFADDRALREEMYRAYVTRAAEFSDQWDNTPLIRRILELRHEQAQLLDFPHYAALSLEPKMARSAQEVLSFLDDMANRAQPFARRDLQELTAFARAEIGLPELQAWDIAYASEKLRSARFDFSEQEVKQYFPQPRVLDGMFRVVEVLYGITITRTEAALWHPDVQFFNVLAPGGTLIGQFYMDLYARPSKRGGAWMDDAITRRRVHDGIQVPVAYLNCNFAGPVAGRPALFSHHEVITLFHEFGHGLHHLLTEAVELGVSGINGVEWDAVELPSQFMENFCWEWAVLRDMSAHVDSGEPLPRALFDKMHAAKNFQSGLHTVRQLEFSLFDLRLHSDFDPRGERTPLQLLEQIRDQVAVLRPPAYNRFPNNFSHIFAGGYAAGYYSYKWAEVLSADAFSVFEENARTRAEGGVLDRAVGERFRKEILAVGGSRPALESFVKFRGREPRIDALLEHHGMTVK